MKILLDAQNFRIWVLSDLSIFQQEKQAEVCLYVISRYQELLLNGALLTVEADRVRIRPPD